MRPNTKILTGISNRGSITCSRTGCFDSIFIKFNARNADINDGGHMNPNSNIISVKIVITRLHVSFISRSVLKVNLQSIR